MDDNPYTRQEKEEIIERLYDLQFALECLNSRTIEEADLEFVESVIYCISDLDKSLSQEIKNSLNDIIVKKINKKRP